MTDKPRTRSRQAADDEPAEDILDLTLPVEPVDPEWLAALEENWRLLKREWVRSLKSDNKSPRTIENYERAARQFTAWLIHNAAILIANGYTDLDPQTIGPGPLRAFQAKVLIETSPGNAHTWHRGMNTFLTWYVTEEEERPTSPMAKVKAPIVPKKPIPLVSDDTTKEVLADCKGSDFISLRDEAIIRLFVDTCGRLSEIADMGLDDVDLDLDQILITRKGRWQATIPISNNTARALSKYLRARARHPRAKEPWLWLGDRGRGRLHANGVKIMLRRRGAKLGMSGKGKNLHAHRWRHTGAVNWRKSGGDVVSMKRIFGWSKNSPMPDHYGEEAQDEIARQHAREIALGDRV
jgi:integrase/recombinase XerC